MSLGDGISRAKRKKKTAITAVSPADLSVPKNAIALLNCITGDIRVLDSPSTLIGGDSSCDIVLKGYGVLGMHCRIIASDTTVRAEGVIPEAQIYIDGNLEHTFELPGTETLFSFQVGAHHFFMLGVGPAGASALRRLNHHAWQYMEKNDDDTGELIGPFELTEILQSDEIAKLSREKTVVCLQGAPVGFRLSQFLGDVTQGFENAFAGEFECPRCWLRFNLIDMFYIAAHPDLRGDDVLGDDEMKRFRPTQFINGRPVDGNGVPCSETACPHCRGKLPHGFTELPIHVFSIIGISSAGKSYYLALLIHYLKRFLVRNFTLSLMDSDGGENRVLNNMIQQLMSAATPEEACLQKTQPGGITYQTFKRFGKDVLLPQPFVYAVRPPAPAIHSSLVIFYDNAGEHFLPTMPEYAESTEHLAHCDTIFFLFDPVRHREFHTLIKRVEDPQVQKAWREDKRNFVQDAVLSEMQRRMQVSRNRSAADRSDKPLAVVVGKYDLWEHLLPESELRSDFVVDGKLNVAAIDHNSQKVRAFMLEHCADIVGCAEAITEKVTYFPVSSFGSHAVGVGTNADLVAPDPEQLQPKFLEIPTVWALSRLVPGSVPST